MRSNPQIARISGVFGGTAAFAAALLCALVATGCGTEEAGGIEGPSTDVGASIDATIAEDVSAAEDAGPEDAGVDDIGPEDTGPEDTGPEDTGPADTGPEDTGPEDTGPVDTGPIDAGPPKDTQGALCSDYQSKFTNAVAAARACATSFSCTDLAPAGMGCKECETYYSHDDEAKVQAVFDVSSESTQKKCSPVCPKQCVDPTKQVGVCGQDGMCAFDAPSCEEMQKRFKLAVDKAHLCDSDADCNFQAQTELPCGCGAYLNGKTFGPGKPLFRYAKMLVTVYNAQKCFTGACACPSFSKAKCESGKCVSLP